MLFGSSGGSSSTPCPQLQTQDNSRLQSAVYLRSLVREQTSISTYSHIKPLAYITCKNLLFQEEHKKDHTFLQAFPTTVPREHKDMAQNEKQSCWKKKQQKNPNNPTNQTNPTQTHLPCTSVWKCLFVSRNVNINIIEK